MVATEVGVIEDDDVARPEGGAAGDGGAYRAGHSPQRDGDMGRLGQQLRRLEWRLPQDMIRLFNHFFPHAVLLLGLFDALLLVAAGELAWDLRASQLDLVSGPITGRLGLHFGFAGLMGPAEPLQRVSSRPSGLDTDKARPLAKSR